MTSSSSDVPSTRCPDEAILAALVDGSLTGDRLEKVRAHLADCIECRTLVADLVRAADGEEEGMWDETVLEPEPELEPVPRPVPVPRPKTGFGPGRGLRLILLAAAGVALFLGVWQVTHHGGSQPPPVSTGGANGTDIDVMRGGESETFTTLSPKDQAVLALTSPAALVLEWSAYREQGVTSSSASADDSVSYYVATVLDGSGHRVWSDRTIETHISPPDSARIIRGGSYTWLVTAHLTFGSSRETRPATFSVLR